MNRAAPSKLACMGKREIPDKLRKLAAIKERQARRDVAAKARAVRDTQDNLEAIAAEQAHSERVLHEDERGLDGAALQLLAMGRAVHRRKRAEVEAELQSHQEALDTSEGAHKETIVEHHFKEKLYAHCLDRDRKDARGREQKANDDSTSTRYGRYED